MKDKIDQFMWGYQQHFRLGVERGVKDALARIGLPVEVCVVLVGFACSDDVQHRVCVEPEDGLLSVSHLSAVLARAEDLFTADPDSRLVYDHPGLATQRRASLFRHHRGEALVEAIEASGAFEGLTFFASSSTATGDGDTYEVHTCVGIPTEELERLPALDGPTVNRAYVGRSLQHEVIAKCLDRADRTLYFPSPGTGLRVLGPPENIVKAAAARLVDGMGWRLARLPTDLFHPVNEFTSLSYERAPAAGCLIVTNSQKADDPTHVRFQVPISLHDSRIMRKLLELSDGDVAVITDGQHAYGLGAWNPGPDVAEISVRGHADWELSVNGSRIIRVTNGHPKLPRPLVPPNRFADTAQRTLESVDLDRIQPIIEAAQNSRHGMMLVVSKRPEEEVDRLGGQAVPITPEIIEPAQVARLGRVDGAVLLGPDGRCHAFGVILDGTAHGRGDPARGSRYNSAVRYQKMVEDAVLVVISDDGTVDLVPALEPKVHQEEVDVAVHEFCNASEADPVDGEEFGRTHRRVVALAFYLNDDQCLRVNRAYDDEMRRRLETGGIAVSHPPLRPHPDMDDSYFH